jgi:flagellar hook assembly protein FlgD
MKKIIISLFIMSIFLTMGTINTKLMAQTQTPGTLTFSVTTTEPSGNYSNVNVLAIWIRDNSGNFVKTKIKYADSRQQYLNVWVSNSGTNVVDAVTGVTLTSHGTKTFTWNATNVSASVVADGNYAVWLQMSDKNANGPTASVSFTKGTSPVHLTPANNGNFTNMSLDWVPAGAGISDYNTNTAFFSVSPNPVTAQSFIYFNLDELTDVTISLYDLSGKLVKVLFDANQSAGSYSLPLNGISNFKSGIYFVKMYTGKVQKTCRILIP